MTIDRLPLIVRIERHYIPEPNSGCWLWTGTLDVNGYGVLQIKCGGGKQKTKRAHRVAWECYRGPIPAGMQILHRCDVRSCISPDHLFLGTHADNMADMTLKQRYPIMRGEKNGFSKLTQSQVLAIRSVSAPNAAIARQYCVSRGCIRDIQNRKTWRHLG